MDPLQRMKKTRCASREEEGTIDRVYVRQNRRRWICLFIEFTQDEKGYIPVICLSFIFVPSDEKAPVERNETHMRMIKGIARCVARKIGEEIEPGDFDKMADFLARMTNEDAGKGVRFSLLEAEEAAEEAEAA